MQRLNSAPREDLDPADVQALIHADDCVVSALGADLLDLQDRKVLDISDDVRSWTVRWDGSADIHRSCELVVTRELAWDRDRVRLWLEMSSALLAVTARFWVGVFVITRPQLTVDDSDTPEHACKGWDKLYLLRSPVGDTWSTRWEESGQATAVGAEVRRVLRAARYTGAVALPVEAESILLPEPMVWPLSDGATSWLRVANDILAAGGCTGLWVDEAGTTRSDLIVPVTSRPVEYVLDDDPRTTLLGRSRTRTQDLALVPNAWRFINSSYDGEPLPGEGIYDPPDNESDGPASIASRGIRHLAVIKLDAADQDTLVRLGDERVAQDRRAGGSRAYTIFPLPLLGHRDVLSMVDPALGDPATVVLTSWALSSDGSDAPLAMDEVTG